MASAEARPGIVVSVATAGDLLQWHPHLHLLTTDGGRVRDGTWHPLLEWDSVRLRTLFRERPLARLVEKRAISKELVAKLLAWRHPGFSAHESAFTAAGGADLDEIFARETIRQVGKDNVVACGKTVLQISKQPGRKTCAGLAVLSASAWMGDGRSTEARSFWAATKPTAGLWKLPVLWFRVGHGALHRRRGSASGPA